MTGPAAAEVRQELRGHLVGYLFGEFFYAGKQAWVTGNGRGGTERYSLATDAQMRAVPSHDAALTLIRESDGSAVGIDVDVRVTELGWGRP